MRLCFKSKVKEQLITVFVVANAQKQGAENTECIEVGYATMFQE